MSSDNIELQNPEENSERSEQSSVTWKEKLLLFFTTCWRGIICVLAPILLILVLIPFPPEKYQWCAYTLSLMAVYWVTECIPLPITSFLPLVIFPLTGVMNTSRTCQCYMNDAILMFLGSLMLAASVQQCGLHKRLALFAIRLIGYSHYRLLFAMSFITMFVSMWITNTAATTMMVPIVFAILNVFENQGLMEIYNINNNGDLVASNITVCYFCSITFSATIGGIGTIVGTATNLVFKGLFSSAYPEAPEYLSFPKFSAFSIPYMLALEFLLYFSMLIMYFGFLRPNSEAAKLANISEEGCAAAKDAVNESWQSLGKITFWEIQVILLFSTAMILFFSRSPQIFTGWGDKTIEIFGVGDMKFVQDSVPAMLIVFLMLLVPYNFTIVKHYFDKTKLPNEPMKSVLDWYETNDYLPYSFMFLLGGGFALSDAAKKEYSNLNQQISNVLRGLGNLPNPVIILIVIAVTVFLTNFAANVAVCNVIVPIVMNMAEEIAVNPLWYNLAAGFSASFCFCLPVGTPGNLIVQGAAKISTGQMIIAGLLPTLFTILVSWVCICFWAPVIWPDLYFAMPWKNT